MNDPTAPSAHPNAQRPFRDAARPGNAPAVAAGGGRGRPASPAEPVRRPARIRGAQGHPAGTGAPVSCPSDVHETSVRPDRSDSVDQHRNRSRRQASRHPFRDAISDEVAARILALLARRGPQFDGFVADGAYRFRAQVERAYFRMRARRVGR